MRKVFTTKGEDKMPAIIEPEADSPPDSPGDEDVESIPSSEGSDFGGIIQHGLAINQGERVFSSPALWIGVGQVSTQDTSNAVVPNAEAEEPVRSGDYANVVYNNRLAHNITYSATGVPIMTSILVETAQLSHPDWRVLGLITALYDTIREQGTTDPAGVS